MSNSSPHFSCSHSKSRKENPKIRLRVLRFVNVFSEDPRPGWYFVSATTTAHKICPRSMDGCQHFCHHLLHRLLVAADLPRNDELILVAPLRSSPKMRSHVLVDMPNLSTISIGASEDIMESHLKSRIMTCICPTSCPISTAPESLYGSPIHNPCPALT
jgi:hypothetical protein